jgi:outer membrane protein assembly factor BamB
MPALKTLLLTTLCLALAASPPFTQQGWAGARLPTSRLLNRYGLTLAWWNQAKMNPSRERVRHFMVDEEIICVQSSSGLTTAFDNEKGRLLWSIQPGRRDQSSFRAASNQDIVLIAGGMKVYAVDKLSGNLLWDFRLPSHPSTSPILDETHMYVATIDGNVHAFDLRTIQQLHSESQLREFSFRANTWHYKTPKAVTTPPVLTGQSVIFTNRTGSLYAVEVVPEQRFRFQFELDVPLSSPLAYADGYLYLASEDHHVYCLNGSNGKVRWDFATQLPVRKVPQIAGEQVFGFPARGGMHCLAARNGDHLWWNPHASEFLAVTPSLVYASDDLGNVILLSRDDGTIQGVLPLRSYDVRFANDRTDRLCLLTSRGLIICIHEQGREFPLFQKFPERRPILPLFAPESTEAEGDTEEVSQNTARPEAISAAATPLSIDEPTKGS